MRRDSRKDTLQNRKRVSGSYEYSNQSCTSNGGTEEEVLRVGNLYHRRGRLSLGIMNGLTSRLFLTGSLTWFCIGGDGLCGRIGLCCSKLALLWRSWMKLLTVFSFFTTFITAPWDWAFPLPESEGCWVVIGRDCWLESKEPTGWTIGIGATPWMVAFEMLNSLDTVLARVSLVFRAPAMLTEESYIEKLV